MNARAMEISRELAERLAEPDAPAEQPETPALELPPGIHRDTSMRDYLRLPYLSASKLCKLDRSPLQYRHALTAPPETTDALERGTALHMAVLEPLLFETHYTVAEPCGILLGKSSKRPGEPCGNSGLFLTRNLGWVCGTHAKGLGSEIDTSREILSAANYTSVLGMRDAILGHARARSLFEGRGEMEVTLVWQDEATGALCKARPDRLVERAKMLVDIKSSRSASPRDFPRLAENLGYFIKLAWYRRGLRALGWPYEVGAVLAIEPDAPFDLAPYLVDEKGLDSADVEIERLLRVHRQCTDTNNWPGYAASEDGFLTLARPAWAKGEAA